MKILLSWLNDFLANKVEAAEVEKALMAVGLEVGELKNLSAGLDDIVVAKIQELDRHPNADKLSLCKVTDGSQDFSVVCGASNMKAGDHVALAKIGTHLPNGLTIKKAKIRGQASEGMLCSEAELKLSEESAGIIVLSENAKVGQSLAQAMERNDWLLDVELTPNRGDCLSVLGMAREVAAALNLSPQTPMIESEGPIDSQVKVRVTDAEGCPRYVLRLLESLKIGESPAWLRNRLESSEVRSINAAVDVTNYVMLEWGQPLHAFDADKVVGFIEVRRATTGEKILCLDEQERSLTVEDLVIADEEGPVAIAGVMGGQRTAVTSSTRRILLESAHFDPTSVRKTSRRLNLPTESSHRFERRVDPAAVWAASTRAVELFCEVAHAKAVDGIDCRAKPFAPKKIVLRKATLRRILGETVEGAGECLARLGLSVEKLEEGWQVEIPTRRPDLEREIDLVEEVARIHGYEKFQASLPPLTQEPKGGSDFQKRDRIRTVLRSAGVNEVYGYSFYSEADRARFVLPHMPPPISIVNPLTADLTIMRQSLFPSLLKAWKTSHSHQASGVRLFEVGRVYGKSEGSSVGPALEELHLGLLFAGLVKSPTWYRKERAADYFDLRGVVEMLFERLGWGGIQFSSQEIPGFLHPGQASSIFWRKKPIGYLGKLHPRHARELEVGEVVIGDLHLDPLLDSPQAKVRYKQISSFPRVQRDIALVVKNEITAEEVSTQIRSLKDPLLLGVDLFDLYEGKGVRAGHRSLAYRLTLGTSERTLKDKEVDKSVAKIIKHLETACQAQLRG